MRKALNTLPSLEYLNECFHVRPDEGVLIWKDRPRHHFPTVAGWKIANANRAGKAAMSTSDRGYGRVKINGTEYLAARIIWKMCHEEEPEVIDHIDQNPGNMAISNLRSVSEAEARKNLPLSKHNVSGTVGVQWNKRKQKWKATIGVNRKRVHLGSYENKADAIKARKAAELEYGYHENHGNNTRYTQ